MANPFTGLFDEAAQQHGLEPDWLPTFARIESGYNPRVRTGSYKGLFQLSDNEFGKHGGQGDIYDPRSNTFAAAAKLRRERDAFEAKYGRKPTAADIYLIHQQGEGGAAAHWSNPNLPAWQNMYSTAEGRQKGPGWAKQAIWGNVPDDVKAKYGSVDNLTSRDFVDLWTQKVARFGGGAPGPGLLPQPPDGMDASTYGATSPPPSKMALGGPKPMPYDANGKYTPQRNIDHEFGLAEMLMGTRAVGPLDGFVLGLGGGYRGKSAKDMTQGNQDYEQGVMRGAFDASSPLLAAEALSRGSPKQRELALSLMLQEKDPVKRLERELKQLEINEKKAAIAEDAQWLGQPSPRPPPAMSPPSAPPPAATQPTIPGTSVVPPTPPPVVTGSVPSPAAFPTPATPAPKRPQTQAELIEFIQATRTPEEIKSWRQLRRTDKKEALKVLDGWLNPNKEQDEARHKKVGEGLGQRDIAALPPSPQLNEDITKGLRELQSIPGRYGGDKGVFGSAIGPLQGDPDAWGSGIARGLGSMWTAFEKESPAEVRRAIQGGQDTLMNVLKKLIRPPGSAEGPLSDADQARLDRIIGPLMQANDVAQYRRELENVRRRINENFRLNIPEFEGEGAQPPGPLPRGAKPDPLGIR
jgi:hypothetical protein